MVTARLFFPACPHINTRKMGFLSIPKFLILGVARIRSSHNLPIWNDLRRTFDNGSSPTQFLSPSEIETSRNEFNSSRLNLFNGHSPVSRLFSVLIDEFYEMDEICIQKTNSYSSRINCFLITEVSFVPSIQVQKRGQRKKRRSCGTYLIFSNFNLLTQHLFLYRVNL